MTCPIRSISHLHTSRAPLTAPSTFLLLCIMVAAPQDQLRQETYRAVVLGHGRTQVELDRYLRGRLKPGAHLGERRINWMLKGLSWEPARRGSTMEAATELKALTASI